MQIHQAIRPMVVEAPVVLAGRPDPLYQTNDAICRSKHVLTTTSSVLSVIDKFRGPEASLSAQCSKCVSLMTVGGAMFRHLDQSYRLKSAVATRFLKILIACIWGASGGALLRG